MDGHYFRRNKLPKKTGEQEPETVEVTAIEEDDNEDRKIRWDGLPNMGTETLTETDETAVEQPNEVETLKAKLESIEQNYKNLQRKYNKKFTESKTTPTFPQTSDNTLELMLQMAKNKTDDMGNVVQDPMIPILTAELEKRRNAEAQQQRFVYQEQVAAQERSKLEDKILEAGLTPDDEAFDDVWEAYDLSNAVDGKFDRAHRKLDRVLKSAKPTEETKPIKQESEAEIRKRIEAEVRKQIMSERGELDVETGQPSGGAQSFRDIELGYNQGKVSKTKYEEARRKAGIS
jgi:hypothetical protein